LTINIYFRATCIGLTMAATLAVPGLARAETVMRISVDTGLAHFRHQMLIEFADLVIERTYGAIVPLLFENGTLYASRDEPRAVARGDVEMTVTYNPSLSTFVPNMNLLDLPIFSGRSPDAVNVLIDGKVGEVLTSDIENQLGVEVLGRWLL